MHDDLRRFTALKQMIGLVPLVDADLVRNHLIRVDLPLAHELQRRLPVVRILTTAADDGQLLLNDLGEIYSHFVLRKEPNLYVLSALFKKIHAEMHRRHSARAVIADVCTVAVRQPVDELLNIILLHVHNVFDTKFLFGDCEARQILCKPRHDDSSPLRHNDLRDEEPDGSRS